MLGDADKGHVKIDRNTMNFCLHGVPSEPTADSTALIPIMVRLEGALVIQPQIGGLFVG